MFLCRIYEKNDKDKFINIKHIFVDNAEYKRGSIEVTVISAISFLSTFSGLIICGVGAIASTIIFSSGLAAIALVITSYIVLFAIGIAIALHGHFKGEDSNTLLA